MPYYDHENRTDHKYVDSLYHDPDNGGCKYCGDPETVERPFEAAICETCLSEIAGRTENMWEYLKAQKRQEIGHTSWTDFFLRVLCGLQDPPMGDYPLSLDELVWGPDEIDWNNDCFSFALDDYMGEDADEYDEYIKWLIGRV